MDHSSSTRGIPSISRDEMNLAEFPLAVLSTRIDPSVKTLEFSDHVKNKSGELIERKWIITGADKFGLPTSSDDEVLLGLIKLTVDSGFTTQKVYFTRYELLRILRWTTEGRSYTRLQKALDRLSGVRIKATNAFYDNESKSHSTRNFGIVDAYEINDGRDTNPKPSFFIWSETIFKSFQVGFIKKLDLDYYLSLQSAVSKRLYRYLDKHFWYRSRVQVNLFTLCHEKIGISRNYRYASSLRQQLDPAINELVKTGFLSSSEYVGKGNHTDVVLFASAKEPRVLAAPNGSCKEHNVNPVVVEAQEKQVQLRELLLMRGVKERQVAKLVEGRSRDTVERMLKIVDYFDSLAASKSRLISKSPVGFLYRAMENPELFVLPEDRSAKKQQGLFPQGTGKGSSERLACDERFKAEQQARYVVFRRRHIEELKSNMSPEILASMRAEVEQSLEKLRASISCANFQKAIEHGVDEKVAKLFAVPEFDDWIKEGKGRRTLH